MGESAVLFHSYSFAAPLSRNETHEDNLIHALSQSVSFGRFMTENLEWGKWSSFSHKKYVDEAEKYSQPGSVAQKKAFFEAHYKRIAEAKKAKALLESSDLAQQQQPESVTGLLNTLETLTNDEVKEEESDETELVVSSIEKDEEHESKSVETLVQEDAEVDKLVVKSAVADDLQAIHETEPKENNNSENEEFLKKSSSVGEKEEERRFVSKNSSVFRSSIDISATSETQEKAMEPILSQKISEKPETHTLMMKNEKPETHTLMMKNEKPVPARFGFLSSLLGSTKTEDQNPTRKKRKMGKKPNNSFLCLCFKPEMVGETEAARR